MEGVLKREFLVSRYWIRFLGLVYFIVLTALGGFVRIPLPFTPVPLTLQSFFVLFSGLVLGPQLAFFSQLGYLTLGVLGLPIFAGATSGFFHLCGPTGGYIFGFLLAAFLVGRFKDFARSAIAIFGLLTLADLVLLLSGTLWLKYLFSLSLSQALSMGFYPFLFGDGLKVFFTTLAYQRMQKRLKEIF